MTPHINDTPYEAFSSGRRCQRSWRMRCRKEPPHHRLRQSLPSRGSRRERNTSTVRRNRTFVNVLFNEKRPRKRGLFQYKAPLCKGAVAFGDWGIEFQNVITTRKARCINSTNEIKISSVINLEQSDRISSTLISYTNNNCHTYPLNALHWLKHHSNQRPFRLSRLLFVLHTSHQHPQRLHLSSLCTHRTHSLLYLSCYSV